MLVGMKFNELDEDDQRRCALRFAIRQKARNVMKLCEQWRKRHMRF